MSGGAKCRDAITAARCGFRDEGDEKQKEIRLDWGLLIAQDTNRLKYWEMK